MYVAYYESTSIDTICRSLVAKSDDALQNPDLIFENVVRVKWLLDIVKYEGPVSVGSDCTKVRARLSYSQDFGSHILGSVLPMDQCEVDDAEDIEAVINRVKEAKAMATQVRAVIVKVVLLTQCSCNPVTNIF